ncbi:unnamed protein product [Nippostrongylus brasiliensis]|uniref:SCP domain-containing protein n=1 Tax=Nippostrongylus brasiliensis TaxID=27835 RepID=A0A158R398_NIPBR|nr:unnamed protein product [Nippostrongylus brasiliensis]
MSGVKGLRTAMTKMHKEGVLGADIARTPRISKFTVYYNLDRLERTETMEDRPRSGGPRTSTAPVVVKRIRDKVCRNPRRSMRELSRTEGDFECSIRRTVKYNIRVRFDAARHRMILFTDESVFTIEQFLNHENDRILARSVGEANQHGNVAEKSGHPKSLVANGLAIDKDGSTVPTAANMLRLRYDCTLERLAVEHANECKLRHSEPKGVRSALGESLVQSIGRTLPEQSEVTTGLWFNELHKNGMGRNLTFGAQEDVYKIGHYTQVVWATTGAIGCAVKECPDGNLAVCNYQPTGNVLEHEVYEEGDPCSKCPDHTYCEDGLCVVEYPVDE